MPKKKGPTTTTIHVRIEDSCLDAVRRKLGDPVTGNIPKGGLSNLVQTLMWEWLAASNKD